MFDPARDKWWVHWREFKLLRLALMRVHCRHLVPIVDQCLARNANANREPANWTQLATQLDRDYPNIYRSLRAGEYPIPSPDFAALGTLLDVDVGELFPEPVAWLTEATRSVLRDECSDGESQAYVRYLLSNPSPNGQSVDHLAVKSAVQSSLNVTENQVNAAVRRVSECLRQIMSEW